jgi:predicted DNA-binding ribbon-helix-helix protein
VYVALLLYSPAILVQSMEARMRNNKLRSVTIRVEPELWDRVERLAREDRRPVAQLLRNIIDDAVAAQRVDAGSAIHA